VRQCEQELASALEKRDAKIAKAVHQWGISHADIGRLLNLTRQAVHTAVQRAIDRP
jgi:biotin operon repressor